LGREGAFVAVMIAGLVLSIVMAILGVILFYSTMNTWFFGSIIVLISIFGVALAILGSEKREERIKQMEERVKKLQAEKEKELQ
jgi:ABC-type multidrug transport system permease subunit